MCYAIPIFENRVAPRYIIAEFIIFLIVSGNKIISRRQIKLKDIDRIRLIPLLSENGADVLVCGGISKQDRTLIENSGIMIIDNVCCDFEDVLTAVEQGKLYSGYGFNESPDRDNLVTLGNHSSFSGTKKPSTLDRRLAKPKLPFTDRMDCLACQDKVCLDGKICRPGLRKDTNTLSQDTNLILEASLDIMAEKERTLCRLTELIYFCLEMKYKKIGVAFCFELFEQTNILVQLLRRYFDVYPVCCKVGGQSSYDPRLSNSRAMGNSDFTKIACNPIGQANVFNEISTDINIIVGLCMGVDCVFAKVSNAPVSTLFVKDKSLAHNPIGALYSDYYRKEITTAKACKT